MTDLVIEVRGGVVVEVYSNTSKRHVTIIDWDNIEGGSAQRLDLPMRPGRGDAVRDPVCGGVFRSAQY